MEAIINVVLSTRESATYAAGVRTLINPTLGHVPFLAYHLGLGNLVRPSTIVNNKVTIENAAKVTSVSTVAVVGCG